MRIYSREDEERVRLQALVREWNRSGLLDDAQRARIETEIHVGLARTNTMLRAGLALFTAIVTAAAIALIGSLLHVTGRTAVAALLGLGAIGCYGAAEWLVTRFRLYRHGVEEMLAAAAVVLVSVSAATRLSAERGNPFDDQLLVVAAIAAIAAFGIYLRFGYVYAAVAAMACAAAVPFQVDIAPAWQRVAAATLLAAAAAVARVKRTSYRDEFPGDEYGTIQAAAFVGVYALLNLKLVAVVGGTAAAAYVARGFYWTTYALTWLLPVLALWTGLRDKDRRLIDVGIATALATLITNKPYLEWTRRPWDPILLGVLLIGIAIVVRRWLIRAPAGERRGFTPLRLLAADTDALARVGTVSVAVPQPAPPDAASAPSPFGGGRSGGAGGGANF